MKKPIIQIENLCKTFVSSNGVVCALSDVSIDILPGEIFGVIGMSGAGKTTLVRCMNMLEKPTSGNVIVDGKTLNTLSKNDLRKARKSISMIFQGFNLLMQQTVSQNIKFALEIAGIKGNEAQKRIDELLKIVDLSGKAEAYPSQLSGGQKQRVAIARALCCDPKILLCDEATSALDPKTTRSILELLKRINSLLGITIVVITHEMSVIREICTRVAVMEGSGVVELGEVEQVFAHPKSSAAKSLFLGAQYDSQNVKDRYRIVFEGTKAEQPIISGTVTASGAPVNIIYANIQSIKNKEYGQMIVELSQEQQARSAALEFLKTQDVIVEKI